MNKTKLIIFIVCGVLALALVGVAVCLLVGGSNHAGVADTTGGTYENGEQTDGTGEAVLPENTGNAEDATADEPTVGVEVEVETTGNTGSSGGSGNADSSGDRGSIDFDDLLGKDEDNKKPTTGGSTQPTTPEPTKPETTKPEETTPDTTTPSATAPDSGSEDDGSGGVVELPGDIPIPIG